MMGIAGKRIDGILYDGSVVAAVVAEMTLIGLSDLRVPPRRWIWVASSVTFDSLDRFERSQDLPWSTPRIRNKVEAPIAKRILLSCGRYGTVVATTIPKWARDMLPPEISGLAGGTKEEAAVARDWLIEHTRPPEMWEGVTLVRGYMIRVEE